MHFPVIQFYTILPEDDDLTNLLLYPIYDGRLSGTGQSTNFVAWGQRKIDTNIEKTITIINRAIISQGTGERSLDNFSDETDYQVAAGKTNEVIFIIKSESSGTQFKILETPNPDDITGGVTKYTYTGTSFNANALLTIDKDDSGNPLLFAADQYITIQVTSSGDSLSVYGAYVVEYT